MNPIVPSSKSRRPYRAPVGMPKGREDWRIGTGVSVMVHFGLLVLLIAPFAAGADILLREQGAGGPGPIGGGGGGRRGTGGIQTEVLRYVSVAPPPPPTVAPARVEILPPPKPEPQQAAVVAEAAPVVTAPTPGVGGGTGADTLGGSGPGSGGGVGSGIGTGRGSGVGSGTGGGTQENHSPTAIEMLLPPLPVPRSARGRIVAEFDVDETGKVRGVAFTQTPDRGYNRRLREQLGNFRFRPGTRPDGTPIRMKWQMMWDLP